MKHIEAKRKNPNKIKEGSDLVSMFLQRTETACDDTILDYLARPLFAAAVGTTQYGLQSMMYFIVAS